jgi:hypothetical protein
MDGEYAESRAAGLPTLCAHGYGGGSGGEAAPAGSIRRAGFDEGYEGDLFRQEGTALFKGRLAVFGEKANHAQPSRQESLEQSSN